MKHVQVGFATPITSKMYRCVLIYELHAFEISAEAVGGRQSYVSETLKEKFKLDIIKCCMLLEVAKLHEKIQKIWKR